MSMRDGYMWTIKNQSGFILDIHVRYERTNAIKDFVKWMDYKDWKYWKRRGFSCIKIKAREIPVRVKASEEVKKLVAERVQAVINDKKSIEKLSNQCFGALDVMLAVKKAIEEREVDINLLREHVNVLLDELEVGKNG